MRKSLRLVLLACASLAGLALAAPALATYTPSLTIEQSSYKPGAATTVDNLILASKTYDPTAKLTIFGPAGYTANITQAPGTKIGHVFAVVIAKALAGAPLPRRRGRRRRRPGDRRRLPALHRPAGEPGDVGPERGPPGAGNQDPGLREQASGGPLRDGGGLPAFARCSGVRRRREVRRPARLG